MTAPDMAATTSGPERDRSGATGGASCRIRRSYGPTHAISPTQEGGGRPVDPRARAHGDRPGSRHQGAPVDQGEDLNAPSASPAAPRDAPFPDRKPRRRTRNRSERPHKMTTRLSDDEKTEIIAAAQKNAVTAARFLASAGLAVARGSVTVHSNAQLDAAIDELAALRAQVARVGNNINQIAYAYNAGGQPHPGDVTHTLTILTRVLARIDATADALVRKRI